MLARQPQPAAAGTCRFSQQSRHLFRGFLQHSGLLMANLTESAWNESCTGQKEQIVVFPLLGACWRGRRKLCSGMS